MRRNLTTGALAVLATAALGATVANAAPSGAAFSTNPGGATVNENHYSKKSDVSINGGPTGSAAPHAAALPNGEYVYRVTDASGKMALTVEEGSFGVEDGRIVWSTGAATTDSSGDILTVAVGEFGDSFNGVYKLWIAPAKKVRGGKFPPRVSKTDNFMIDANLDGDPDRPDDPDPDQDPPSDPDQDPPPPPDGGGQTF